MKQEKHCKRCGRTLDLSTFNKSTKYGTQSQCRDCQKVVRAGYRLIESNRERERIQGEQYRIKNHERLLKYGREYYYSHLDERAANRLKHYKNNPEYYWAYDTLRGHEKRGMDIRIDVKELIKLAKEAKRCPICNVEYNWRGTGRISENKPSLDRIDNGNILSKDMIWIICQKCNAAKGDKPMKEFVNYCGMVARKFGGMYDRSEMDQAIDADFEIKQEAMQ